MSKDPPPRAWQRMLSGRRLNLLDPSPLDVELADIAHGLARVARWNGQTFGDHAFSVAQHSLLVEDIATLLDPRLSARDQLVVLLHDAAEYVIGDLISPFKHVIGGSYTLIEEKLKAAVHQRFALPHRLPAGLQRLIKRADRTAAYFEAVELAGFSRKEARQYFGLPRGIGRQSAEGPCLGLHPLPAIDAEKAFTARFLSLQTRGAEGE